MIEDDLEIVLMPLNYNGRPLLERCLPLLEKELAQCSIKCEIWVIDNASTDDSEDYVQKHHPNIRFKKYPENQILATYNQAAQECNAPYLLFLNNDIFAETPFIESLYSRLTQDKAHFAVSPKINSDEIQERYPHRRVGHFFHGHLGYRELKDGAGGCTYFHGGAVLLRRDYFLKLGGFDPLFFYYEDNDLSYRAWRQGWNCIFEPSAQLFHAGAQTTKQLEEDQGLKKRALKEKASSLFILKNIQDMGWLINYTFWTALKCLKMVLTWDKARMWAMKEVFKQCSAILQKRAQQKRLNDKTLMKKISDLKLPPLKS